MSAVFSVVAGIVSAHLAGEAAVRTTAQQLSGETEKSQAEFLRGQRQTAYANMINDEEQFRIHELALSAIYQSGTEPATPADFEMLRKPIDKSYLNASLDAGNVELIGSSEVVGIANQIRDINNEKYYWVIVAGSYIDNKLPTDAKSRQIGAGLSTHDQKLTELEAQFKTAARKDLGTN